ncbi:DUF945 family protein [Leucothrix arctica]|uniref:DUF945 domain-containing protein n=1 Tax=Leucothrix arctica TaxID=1481894 RepID=A0A317CID5_9GAMM|nr:DUF945 family protein [Leucothrix arctica]PWQ98325.1 hypothetical protein DKT75_04115 [Leucothrix arctica]
MKKLLIAVPLIAIVGGAAAPFVIGSKVESAAKQYIELGNQQMEKALAANPQLSEAKFELDSYEKGYLNAKATGKVTFTANLNLNGAKTYTIPFTSDVKHGPYLGDAGFGASSIVTRPDLSGFDLPESINEDTIIMSTIIGFAGDMKNNAVIAPISFENDGANLDFAGAVINSVSPDAKNRSTFTGDAAIQQLKITPSNGEAFVLKPFTIDMEGKGEADLSSGTYSVSSSAIEGVIGDDEGSFSLQKMDAKGTYKDAEGTDVFSVGSAEVSFSDIEIKSENLPEAIKLPKLSFSSAVEQNSGTDFDIHAKYSATLDPSLMQMMRSPVDVQTAEIGIKLKGFSIEVMEQYQALIEQLVEAGDQGQAAAEAIQGKALGIAQLLVKNASSANLEIHAKSTEGDLDADVDVGFKPGLELSETELMGLMGAPDPSRLLAILVGRGDVSLAKGITDKAGVTPMIQMMAADFVTLDGETFKSDVKITDGKLLINGNPLPMMGGM